jgi:hypothetical protein
MVAAAGRTAATQAAAASLPPDGAWRIEGDGLELVLAPVGSPQSAREGAPITAIALSLAHAEGAFTIEAERYEADCQGFRQTLEGLLAADWQALHNAAAWFADDYGIALTALHPRGANTHAEASVVAAVLGNDGQSAEDPRLSTTYRADERVARAGLELWLPEGEGDDLYPVRASGEAIGPGLRAQDEGVSLQGQPFRWFSRDRTGSGVYLLARR